MKSTILSLLTLSTLVFSQSTIPSIEQPNHKISHPSKKYSRSNQNNHKHNSHHASPPLGDKYSKRSGVGGAGGGGLNESALKNASGLQNSLSFLICILSDEVMTVEKDMGLTITTSNACAAILGTSQTNPNVPVLTAIGGAGQMFTSTAVASLIPSPTSVAIASPVVSSTPSATSTSIAPLADSDSLAGEGGTINTSTYVAPVVTDLPSSVISPPSPTIAPVLAPVVTAVTVVIKVQMIGDEIIYYYPKDLESPATSDINTAAKFILSTSNGKCQDASSAGNNGIAPRFDLSSKDYSGGSFSYLGGTLEAKDSFDVMDGAPLSPLNYNSPIPFVIQQPHNHYSTRTFETTLWSFEDCNSSQPFISAHWQSTTNGLQDLLICANADSMNTRAPSDFFLSYKPGSTCGLEFNATMPATKVQVNFTFVPTDGSAFYP